MNRYRVTYANGNQDEVVYAMVQETQAGSLQFSNDTTAWVVAAGAWCFLECLGPVEEE